MARSARFQEDYAARIGDNSWGITTKFFLIWTAGPIVVRLLLVWFNTPFQETLLSFLNTVFTQATAAVPQDFLVSAEAFIVCFVLKGLIANRWFGWRGCLVASLISTMLLVVVQVYILCDFLIFFKTGAKLDASLFLSISQNCAFNTLAAAYGLAPLLFGLGAILALAVYAFQFYYEAFPDLMLTYRNLFWIVLSITTGLASAWFLPADLAYSTNNPVVQDEARWLLGILRGKGDLPVLRDEAALLAPLRQGEQFDPVQDGFPLLKNTREFSGEKQFEIRIDADERPHVIFLELESFRAANVGILGGKLPASPNFDRLSQEGILFTEFYANGVRPPRADIASLFGILPNYAPREVQVTNSNLALIGLPDILRRNGYQCAFMYGSSLEFDNLGNFAKHHGFEFVQGIDDLRREYPTAARNSWGIHDEYLLHHLATWLEKQDAAGHPSFVFAKTTSNRQPYQTPPAFKAPHFDVPADGEYAHFLGTFSYTDACLGAFMKMLRDRGLDKKTIVFVYADHGMPMGEHFDNYSATNYLYEENLRIPFLILAPGRIDKPTSISAIGSQVDLLPTLMDLLNLTGVNHSLGSSLMREVPSRSVYFNNPFGMQYVGIRDGNWKYIYSQRARTSLLFDLRTDPEEMNDLADAQGDLVRQLHARAVGLNQWMTRNYWQESFTPRDAAANDPKAATDKH
jgi:arylsulfatase A-like enzyme